MCVVMIHFFSKKRALWSQFFFHFFQKTSVVEMAHDSAAEKAYTNRCVCSLLRTLPSRLYLDKRGFLRCKDFGRWAGLLLSLIVCAFNAL